MAVGRLCLDRLRLSRRTHTLRLAVDQLAIRHRRHVRLSQGQFLLLQSMVGLGVRAAPLSTLELGAAGRRTDLRLGTFQPRFGRAVREWQKTRLAKSPASDPSRGEGERT